MIVVLLAAGLLTATTPAATAAAAALLLLQLVLLKDACVVLIGVTVGITWISAPTAVFACYARSIAKSAAYRDIFRVEHMNVLLDYTEGCILQCAASANTIQHYQHKINAYVQYTLVT
jgi:hypothetical protein